MPQPVEGILNRDFPSDVQALLAGFAKLVQDCVDFGTQALVWCDKQMSGGGYHLAAILLLYRHILESAEGTSVLIKDGCGEQCKSPLRTALEATISLEYIFEADTERRALAYQVAHAHKRILAHTKHDPTTTAGQEHLKILASDKLFPVNKMRRHNSAARINDIAKLLAKPEYTPIDQEWDRMRMKNPKRKGLPVWHSLFGGPENVRQLAKHVKMLGAYDVLYSHWSEYIHAGSAMEAIIGMDKTIRPLRDPTGCQLSASLSASFTIHAIREMIARFAPAQLPEYGNWYTREIRERYMALPLAARLKID